MKNHNFLNIFPSQILGGFFLFSSLTLLSINVLAATTTVVPGGLETVEGGGNNVSPFLSGSSSVRNQQVYSASGFSSWSSPAYITRIAFRQDGVSGGEVFSTTFPNIQIDLSTTSAAPDALSTTFVNNLGPDLTTVYSGELTLSSMQTYGSDIPYAFDIWIGLQTPFLYDPTKGNLLMDVRNFNTRRIPTLDAVNIVGDGVSRVSTGTSQSVSSSSGIASSIGLVAQFTAVPIPEPTTFCAVVVALGLAILRREKR